jgi:3-oxoacyl-[acyl-carrier-protein] synthase-3
VIHAAGLEEKDISWVIPHQANFRIIEAAMKKLDIPPERFCSNIDRYGNTSAASIPILIDELNRDGKLKNGDYLALCSFGGGLSSAACIIRWIAG